jgi:uncharacterized protein
MKLIRPFCIWLALLLVAACSSHNKESPVVATQDGKPALWKVTARDNEAGTAYLFGTVHALPPQTKWQGPVIDAAINTASELVIEVTGLDDKAAVGRIFADMGMRHGLPPLSQRVGSPMRKQLLAVAEPVEGPMFFLDGMETWAAALTIASTSGGGLGLDSNSGVEAVLQLRFSAEGKPVSGLENIKQQFSYFDGLSENEQRFMLSAIVKDAEKSGESYQKLLDHWLRGDTNALLAEADAGLLSSPTLREVLLDGRNRKWAVQIAAMVDHGRTPFVAVGAGHLSGAGGVPALLKAKGYIVERVQ